MALNEVISAWVALCMQCAPMIHPATTVAIINTESKGNPFAIGDNTTGKSYSPKDKNTAINIAYQLLRKGHNIDIGLMQVNSVHLKNSSVNYQQLFDPCTNMNIGSKILLEFYKKHDRPNQNSQITLLKALSAYNTGSPYKGYYNGYIQKVLKNTNPEFVFYNNNESTDKNEINHDSQEANYVKDEPVKQQTISFAVNADSGITYK